MTDAHHLFAQSSGGLGGSVSKSDDRLQISAGDGGSTFLSWEFLKSSGPFSAQGGDGGDAALGSSGVFAGQGRGGGVMLEAERAPANRSGPTSELKSVQ